MKQIVLIGASLFFLFVQASAQDEEGGKEKRKFSEHLFTGGSVSLGFSNNTFSVGGNPVLGYELAKWIDAGIALNYTYASIRYFDGDKLHQSIYGGGVFAKIYPVRFIFLQVQAEHNFIRNKYYPYGGLAATGKTDNNSLLIGGGYTTGRFPGSNQPHFYLAVLFDVADNQYSPYKDEYDRVIPIVRAGIQVPLFRGRGR